jgi:hypothetical protein
MEADVPEAVAVAPQRSSRRRAAVVFGSVALTVSLVGGITMLVFSDHSPTRPAALTPRSVPAPVAPPSAEAAPPSASGMDFLGGMSGGMSGGMPSGPASTVEAYADQSVFIPSAPIGTTALPALQPPAPLPVGDWLGPLQSYLQAYIDSATQAVSAEIANSITSNVLSNTFGAAANVAAVAVGDLILYAAYTNNNGMQLLNQIQNALPAIIAPPLAAEAPILPDFSGLNAAFAAVAQIPDTVGWAAPPQLPQLPTAEQVAVALAALPALPSVEQVAAALAAVPQLNLPQGPTAEQLAIALAAVSLPQLPPLQLPQLPRAEDVVGGIVAGAVTLAAVGVVMSFFQPPSLTRMMGLPF